MKTKQRKCKYHSKHMKSYAKFENRCQEFGYQSIREFCDVNELNFVRVKALITGAQSIFGQKGKPNSLYNEILFILDCKHDDIFCFQIAVEDKLYQYEQETKLVWKEAVLSFYDSLSDKNTATKTVKEFVNALLGELTERERLVIQLRFGMGNRQKTETLDSIAGNINVTRGRVSQIQGKALRKMRHPSRVINSAAKIFLNSDRYEYLTSEDKQSLHLIFPAPVNGNVKWKGLDVPNPSCEKIVQYIFSEFA